MKKNKFIISSWNSNNPVKGSKFDPHQKSLEEICYISIDWITITGLFLKSSAKQELTSIGWVIAKPVNREVFNLELQEKKINHITNKVDINVKARIQPNEYRDTWSLRTSNHITKSDKEKILKAVSYFIKPKITRIDLAFDFINFNDAGMHYRFYKPGTKTTTITNTSGKVETIYCGSSKSNRQYRYYNKLRERTNNKAEDIPKSYYSWERLELTTKNRDLDHEVKRMLTCFKRPKYANNNLKGTAKIAFIGLSEHPELISVLSKNTKKKYKEYLEKYQGYDANYSELALKIFNANKTEIVKEVESFIKE